MPTTVLLIRHPESAWNKRGIYQGQIDTPLSDLGRLQADLVAARLARDPVSSVVSSPLGRAKSLASAIAAQHDLAVDSDDRLTEIGHGAWEGKTRSEVQRQFPEMYDQWTERPHKVTFPGGESLRDVHARSVDAITEILERPGSKTCVVVTHDTVVRLVVAAANDRPLAGFSCVALENAAITTLLGPSLVGSVQSVNDVEHLGEHRVNLESQAL